MSDTAPGDSHIRKALRSQILPSLARDADAVIFDELGLFRGQARIDVAVVNAALHGYEIKSDRDSVRRLATQVRLFSKVFDRATLVVGTRHLSNAVEMIPNWWGILRVQMHHDGQIGFEVLKLGRENPGRDPRALAELLWREEAIAFLAQRDAARGVRCKPRHVLWDRICEHFGVDEIATAVRRHLKTRGALQAAQ